jgi:hypothetical protein
MKSSILYAGAALACALGLSACGGGDGDLPLTVSIAGGVTKDGLVLVNKSNGDEIAVPAGTASIQFPKYLSTDDEFDVDTKTLPSNVSGCQITNGKARANYYTVYTTVPTVFCTIKPHDLGVTVNGLTGSGLVLVNGSDRQTAEVTGNRRGPDFGSDGAGAGRRPLRRHHPDPAGYADLRDQRRQRHHDRHRPEHRARGHLRSEDLIIWNLESKV